MTAKNLAILGLILSIFVGPIGAIISIVALNKMKAEGNDDGKVLAIISVVLGAIWLVSVIGCAGCVGCAACLGSTGSSY